MIGALACLALLALLIVSLRRRRAAGVWPISAPQSSGIGHTALPTDDSRTPMPLLGAAALALAIGAVCAFVFALRAGRGRDAGGRS